MGSDDQSALKDLRIGVVHGFRHRWCGLANREQERSPTGVAGEARCGLLRDDRGAGRTDRRLRDDQEIASPGGARICQWRVLGSDQAERPVNTSNFLRSRLTT